MNTRNLLITLAVLSVSTLAHAEDWKGKPETSGLDVGALAGLSNLQGAHGFGILGTVSKKIVPHGFIADLNNSVSLELALGPHLRSAANAMLYVAQLRWDFQKDDRWVVYAVGGLRGCFGATGYLHTFDLYPSFGVGAMLSPTKDSVVRFRAEVTHELIAVGFNIPLWI